MKVVQPISCTFDPLTQTEAEPGTHRKVSLATVFSNPIAAIYWMCWRPNHIVNQYFNAECLSLAASIKKRRLIDANDLRMRTWHCCSHNHCMSTDKDDEYWQDVFEYLSGRKPFQYEIRLKREIVARRGKNADDVNIARLIP